MKKIIGTDGNELADKLIRSVKGVSPCGSQVLVEVLTQKELMETFLEVSEGVDAKVPLQGYIRAKGPGAINWGFEVGDRVLISGTGVMAPNYDETHRDRFLMEPSAIKAVLNE